MKIKFTFLLAFILFSAQAWCAGQKEKKDTINFNVRLEPVLFLDLNTKFIAYNSFTGVNDVLNSNRVGALGGLHAAVGVAINKKYHIDLVTGFETNFDAWRLPVCADFNINFGKKRFRPFIHFGGGYMSHWLAPRGWNFTFQYNGACALAGIGVYTRINKFLAASLSPDYRFIYLAAPVDYTDNNGTLLKTEMGKYLIHNLGFRLSLIFY